MLPIKRWKYYRGKLYLMTLIGMALNLGGCVSNHSYILSPSFVGKPDQRHELISRKFQGIPSLAIDSKGRLWATWYAGSNPKEDHSNYVVVASSSDEGKTWVENQIIDPDGMGPVRAFDPQLWMSPAGVLWSFWAQTIGRDGTVAGVWAMTNDNPEADSVWTQPRRLANGIMMGKPTVLSSGEWVLPVSTWRKTDNSAKVLRSIDRGKTWNLLGGCNIPKDDRNYDEHMIVEKKDKSLWLLARTRYGIGECFSTDGGKTWSTLSPSSIQHPPARFFVRRLRSGNLLLVKHGPIHQKIGRSHLTAFLSTDEGQTWSNGLVLDSRSGVSYPDGQQDSDGVIHIIYDHSRTGDREILMAKFTENDVIGGNQASESVFLRLIVSKYPTIKR